MLCLSLFPTDFAGAADVKNGFSARERTAAWRVSLIASQIFPFQSPNVKNCLFLPFSISKREKLSFSSLNVLQFLYSTTWCFCLLLTAANRVTSLGLQTVKFLVVIKPCPFFCACCWTWLCLFWPRNDLSTSHITVWSVYCLDFEEENRLIFLFVLKGDRATSRTCHVECAGDLRVIFNRGLLEYAIRGVRAADVCSTWPQKKGVMSHEKKLRRKHTFFWCLFSRQGVGLHPPQCHTWRKIDGHPHCKTADYQVASISPLVFRQSYRDPLERTLGNKYTTVFWLCKQMP